jgi:hypothetical protein
VNEESKEGSKRKFNMAEGSSNRLSDVENSTPDLELGESFPYRQKLLSD